jgi:glycerophosphoryl diester phosphodiesterase
MKKCHADGISPLYKIMKCGFVKRMHFRNIKVSVWTVNDEKLMQKLCKKGVDSIVTNYPDLCLKVRNQLQK